MTSDMMERREVQQRSDAPDKKAKVPPPTTTISRHATPSMTAVASCRAVIDTAELLELIMLELPMSSILTSQRVCRQFRDSVAMSTKIQEKLFFRTTGDCEYWAWKGKLENGEPVQYKSLDSRHKARTVPSRLHDFFQLKGCPPLLAMVRDLRADHCTIIPNQRMMEAITSHFLDPQARQAQSWERMHLTNCAEGSGSVHLTWRVADEAEDKVVVADFKVKDGATLGDVVAALRTPRYITARGDLSDKCEDLSAAIRATGDAHGLNASMRILSIRLRGVVALDEGSRAILETSGVEGEEMPDRD